MRILHTADWHLGKRLNNVLRLKEQTEVLQEICSLADEHNVDAVLIAGDLFDTFNPPNDAIELFYLTLRKLSNDGKRLVVAIAGNHDSPERIEAPDPLARACGIVLSGYPHSLVQPFALESGLRILRTDKGFIEVQLPHIAFPLRLILTPYANEYRVKTYLGSEDAEKEMRLLLQQHWQELANNYCDEQGVNILVTHLFMVKQGAEEPEEPEEEKSIKHVGGAQSVYTSNLPQQLQYVALGHLHRPFTMDEQPCPVVYSGSPLSYSFSEANQNKRVVLLDAQPGKNIELTSLPLKSGKPLLRHKAPSVEEALIWLQENQHALVELTVVTEHYLTVEDKKRIYAVHDGIIHLIPELKNQEFLDETRHSIDLTQDIESLFISYFTTSEKLPPNDEMLALFREINALNDQQ